MSGTGKTRGGGKLRERVAALEEQVAAMETASVSDLIARADALEAQMSAMSAKVDDLAGKVEAKSVADHGDGIAQLREIGEMAAKSIAELRVEIEGKLAAMREDIAEISKRGGVTASRPLPIAADEAERLMRDDPNRRWISLSARRDLGLKPGETFDPRAKFRSPESAKQYVHAGLKVCAAPQ